MQKIILTRNTPRSNGVVKEQALRQDKECLCPAFQ